MAAPAASGASPAPVGLRAGRAAPVAALAAVAYLPLLMTGRGLLNADTKQYLYLAPGRLLERAPYLWDSNVGLGTVTHQNIGYLWPMGPFFWAGEQLGLPDWVAQRLWLGSILFAAGAGVLFLLTTLRLDRPWGARLPAALVYMLTPYTLGYLTGASVILLPYAALPWILGLTVGALRRGGWRHPALIALVVTTVGGINASSLLYVAVAPALWLPFAVWVTREHTARRAAGVAVRTAALTAVTQLWWLAALWVGGAHGLPILRTTESIETVAHTSSAPEVMRGLGYWFFYGGDNLGLWLPGIARPYQEHVWLVAVAFLLPLVALAAAAAVRWRHRPFFVTMALAGTVLAVGAHAAAGASPFGSAFRAAARRSDLVLSLRNTQRAVPLVALAFAVLTGAGLAALADRLGRRALAAGGLVAVLAVANVPALWTGQLVADRFHRPQEIPSYWREVAAHLRADGDRTRVLELPGSDFAAYRWGNTLDPVTPGLVDRPVAAREIVPFGSPAAVSLMNALDRRMQEGTLEPRAIAPVARLMGAGDVLVRFDLEYERYRTPRPWVLWDLLHPAPAGLGLPVRFGTPRPNRAVGPEPLVDEIALATLPAGTDPPPVAVFPVEDPLPLARARPLAGAVIVAGDGDGVVEAASAGLVDGRRPVLYAASLTADPPLLARVLDAGADLVLTDTNRRRAERWYTLRENAGYTEVAGETPLRYDPTDARLPVFPDAGDDAATVAELRGVSVRATGYGNPVSYIPDDRPALAVDGDLATAWRVGGFSDVTGERIELQLDAPVTADRINVVQPQRGPVTRWITEVEVQVGDRPPFSATLGPGSRVPEGETLTFPAATFSTITITIRDTDVGRSRTYRGAAGVGFAEIRVGDVRADELIRLPVDIARAIDDAGDRMVAVVVARLRANPAEPVRTDPERSMARRFELPPGPSPFEIAGTARVSALVPDEVIDRLAGMAPAEAGGVTARSSGRLPGDLRSRAASALDGDTTTAWRPGFLEQEDEWIEVSLPGPRTFDRLDLVVLADGRHSLPRRLRLTTDSGDDVTVFVPPVPATAVAGHTEAVPLRFPAVSGTTLRVSFPDVDERRTPDWYSDLEVAMPLGIAELGIPGVVAPAPSPTIDTGCRRDLLTIDGRPLGLRITGPTAAGLARDGLSVEACTGPVDLAPGAHELRTAAGAETGIDLDRLVLRTPDAPDAAADILTAPQDLPDVRVVDQGRTTRRIVVEGASAPFWLVLAESHNDGWRAEAGGRSLGDPVVLDGFANGWLLDPSDLGEDVAVSLRWEPQRVVWAGLAGSTVGVVVCLVLVAVASGRRRRTMPADTPSRPPWGPSRPLLARGRIGASPASTGTPTWRVAVLTAAAAGLVALAVSTPALAVVTAVLVAAGLLVSRPGYARLPALVGVVAFALAAAYVVRVQWRDRLDADFTWPEAFHRVHWLAFAAAVLLAADAVVERVRDRRR